MCSNRETDFIKIDKKENRFWVNLVPKYTTEKPELLKEICQQIPAFLYELHHRKITHDKKTRMWFDYSLIETQATQNLKEESKSNVEKIMCDYVNEMCDMVGTTQFERTITDIRADLDHFFGKNKVNTQDITKFLKKEKKLMPTSSTRYTYYNFTKLIKKEIIDDTTGEVIEIAENERKTGKVYLLKQDDFPIL